MIAEALRQIGIGPAILVVHSWSGALGARMALDDPKMVAGLVMLAPVTYPWPGGVGWYNRLIATPVVGPLLAYTVTLPLGYFLAEPGARNVFLPRSSRTISSARPPLDCCCGRANSRQCPRPGDAEGGGQRKSSRRAIPLSELRP